MIAPEEAPSSPHGYILPRLSGKRMEHLMWYSHGPQVFSSLHLLAEIKGRVPVGEAVSATGPGQAPHFHTKAETSHLTDVTKSW